MLSATYPSIKPLLLTSSSSHWLHLPNTKSISICSEEQARGLLKNDVKAKDANSGDILNKEGTMEYHEQKGELSIQFRNMVNILC